MISAVHFIQIVLIVILTIVAARNAPVGLGSLLLDSVWLAQPCTTLIAFCVFPTMVAVLNARLALGIIL